jgi:D-arabinose 1-dehydrogenase-like Zn-dependent alcohol dehydrogenase
MIREMFHFAERRGVHARTETFAHKEVNQALDHERKNQARYRVVLDCQSVT